MILSLVLGDGCLHNIKNNGKLYGGLTIAHGLQQADYTAWKAQLLSTILNKNIRTRTHGKGQAIQLSVCVKRFRAWRKFCYPNDKKDVSRILPFITNPEFAMAVWLMDDGYVEAKDTGKSAKFRIFTCSESPESHVKIIAWFKDKFGMEPKIFFQKKGEISYPYIKFNNEQSLELWKIIRTFVLNFKSMRHKFRYIERIYQYKLSQCTARQ